MKILLETVSFLLVLACPFFSIMEAARAADKTVDKSNLTILGLTPGDCTSQDIYSKLGPSIPFKDDANPAITHVCYASDKDETLILFSSEYSQCFRFRLMSQKTKFHKWHFCEKSPLISKHLATESGLKLGMSKRRMKAIIGVPKSEEAQTLSFVYVWTQKMPKSETERASQYSKDVKKNPHRTLKATIRAEFSDAGLISFDLLKFRQ